MKKMSVLLVMLVMAVAFAGCPRAPQDPASGDGYTIPPLEVKQGIHVYLDLNAETKAEAEKGNSYPGLPINVRRQVGANLKGQASWLWLVAYAWNDLGKGGGNYYNQWYLPIDGGVVDETIFLPVGGYSIQAVVMDKSYNGLFDYWTSAKVTTVEITRVTLDFDFLYSYNIEVQMFAVPGTFSDGSEVVVLDVHGNSYSGTLRNLDIGQVGFDLSIPLDFEGNALALTDIFGQKVLANFPLKLYELLGVSLLEYPYCLSYQLPTEAGQLAFDVRFGFESLYVRVNGVEFNSIQEAVKLSSSPMTVEIGDGDYYGFDLTGLGAKDVRLVGLGANRTRLVRDESGDPIIHMDASGKAGKAGGNRLIMENLSVIGYTTDYWLPSVDLWGCDLEAKNCYFEGSGPSLVTVAYPLQVLVSHCLFNSNANAVQLEYYNPAAVWVQDCIFTGWSYAAVYLPTAESNGYAGMTLANCCVFGFDVVPTAPVFVPTTNFIFDDPLIDWVNTKLPMRPDSPCIGTATDGGNIGLLWSE